MTMRSSSGTINVAASAQKINVDDRISLRYYYRIADNILRQAAIFREEKNIIDLYVMLLRFSSLATETIPFHRDYRASLQRDKLSLKKKSLSALTELEDLKPAVRQKIDDLSRKHAYQSNGWSHLPQTNLLESSKPLPERSSVRKQTLMNSYSIDKQAPQVNANGYVYQDTRIQMNAHANPLEEQARRLYLNIPRAKEETLSRHSILGPNGLRGQWQAPSINIGVRYPSNIDLTPVEIPRENKLHLVEDGVLIEKISSNLEQEKSTLESITLPNNNNQPCVDEPDSLISFEEKLETPKLDIIRQPSPPPVLAEVQDLLPTTSPLVKDTGPGSGNPTDGVVSPLELHISTKLMDHFMKLAKSNTNKNLETCGILAGSLKNRKFYVTALIIPKQEATSDSCQATHEEEIFEVQDKRSLFALGWIHTHPTQSCFMSSIDVHTHYAYQIMLPEAIAIVMAPRDSSRTHGIFRLTTPGGMGVIRNCPHRGFHAHDAPSDGNPIYKQCTDVYINPKLKFDVIDLR
ncbi:AMSH-like ubiquitin thioesterase 1 isoform X1 [Cynara cardunculus var. scolymus]|uniref:AMSH-like ubiquitin thioesterase 1 isoform X1 n=1 Tax=Cynara cardunculus var. scolymus TaxID=59895 RepID=UPI000D6267F1|nr:AMSH-like ubiquitin thioesterase 1 isoform X1 [Cynara cardunculus var. scolymus]